jgi:hypothetical protein
LGREEGERDRIADHVLRKGKKKINEKKMRTKKTRKKKREKKKCGCNRSFALLRKKPNNGGYCCCGWG